MPSYEIRDVVRTGDEVLSFPLGLSPVEPTHFWVYVRSDDWSIKHVGDFKTIEHAYDFMRLLNSTYNTD